MYMRMAEQGSVNINLRVDQYWVNESRPYKYALTVKNKQQRQLRAG